MSHDTRSYGRGSIRLPEYDYSSFGPYFLTICAWRKMNLFGNIDNGIFIPNDVGDVVRRVWEQIPAYQKHVAIDEFVVMPNHIHGILTLTNSASTLGTVVRTFKSVATKETAINSRPIGGSLWQRNYFERVIRNNLELADIRQYIRANPMNWAKDKLAL